VHSFDRLFLPNSSLLWWQQAASHQNDTAPLLVTMCSVFPSLCVRSVSTGNLATSPVPGTVLQNDTAASLFDLTTTSHQKQHGSTAYQIQSCFSVPTVMLNHHDLPTGSGSAISDLDLSRLQPAAQLRIRILNQPTRHHYYHPISLDRLCHLHKTAECTVQSCCPALLPSV
jgi:hypothetical protein